jgi:hypothetical protein
MNKKNYYPHVFVFSSKKLHGKAREYRHEVFHVVQDLIDINRKIQIHLALCTHIINNLGASNKEYRVNYDKDFGNIEELRYHIENFIFRVHAYREKVCLFINYALNIGYTESQRDLLNSLLQHHIVKTSLIDTELIKLKEEPFLRLLSKRKLMSHKSYYDSGLYNPYFMPNDESLSAKKIGKKKASIEWRRNIKKEPENIDECLEKIFDFNEKTVDKILSYLNKKV